MREALTALMLKKKLYKRKPLTGTVVICNVVGTVAASRPGQRRQLVGMGRQVAKKAEMEEFKTRKQRQTLTLLRLGAKSNQERINLN